MTNPADRAHDLHQAYTRAWYTTSSVEVFAHQILKNLEALNQDPTNAEANEAIHRLGRLMVLAAGDADAALIEFARLRVG